MSDIPDFILEQYPDWDLDDISATCPHGTRIEHDGECPDGCESPLRQLGLI